MPLEAKTIGEKLAIFKTIICSYCPIIATSCNSEPLQYIEYLKKNPIPTIEQILTILYECKDVVTLLEIFEDKNSLKGLEEDLRLYNEWVDAQEKPKIGIIGRVH